MPRMQPARILVIGGGATGLCAARRISRRVHRGEAEVLLVDPLPFMTYAPFLPECAAGSLEPRHLVVPHRDALRRGRVLTASVLALSHEHRSALVQPNEGPAFVLRYDHVIVAVGSVARAPAIPGLLAGAIGFRSIDDRCLAARPCPVLP